MSGVDIYHAEITFGQSGNTMSTTSDLETLTVSFEFQMPGEEPFAVLKTEGWSISDLSDLDFITAWLKRLS